MVNQEHKNFFSLNFNNLVAFLKTNLYLENNKASMRARQLWNFVYKKGYLNIDSFLNISETDKKEIQNLISFQLPKISKIQHSKDGTIKWLIELFDKNLVECVFIPEQNRGTLCISSQVGCTLNCRFCHTGTQRLVKNLEFSEIIIQIMIAKKELQDWKDQKKITNIVLMGMGEPLYNYSNVKETVEILRHKDGLNYGPKKITLSTAGVADKIMDAAKEIGTYLAISLHAPNDEIRQKIMPINKKFTINSLIESCKHYSKITKDKITLEYVMLDGVNDNPECAKELTKIMAKFPCKVNLIEFNPWPGVQFKATPREKMEQFSKIIQKAGYVSTIRRSRGKDILGACGQLRTESIR